METRIKERLTGALILVALLVILVPELLSGRAARDAADAVPEARPATEGAPLMTYKMQLDGGTETVAGQAALNVQPAQQADHLPPPVSTVVPSPSEEPLAQAPQPPAPVPAAAAAPAAPSAQPPVAAPVAAPAAVAAAPQPAHEAPAKAKIEKPAEKKPADKKPADKKPPPVAADKAWFVQLGVFAKRENAEQLVKQLARKGQTAHISGSGSALRVRIGPVADRAAAQALKKRLAADGVSSTLVPPP